MEVFYDRKNDVVSIYFDIQDETDIIEADRPKEVIGNRKLEMDEAANLVLDMVDLIDRRGNIKGFRVFNATRYYDIGLLNTADAEELTQEEMSKKPLEKVVGRFFAN